MKYTKKTAIIRVIIMVTALFICAEPLVALNITINEVLYNPPGSDNNQEFIELAVAEPLNLAEWLIADTTSSDRLALLQPFNSTRNPHLDLTLVLIVEEGFNYTGINTTVYSAGASIGNGLHNTQESITLSAPNGTVVATMSYNQTLEGYSLVLFNGTYVQGSVLGGTPGQENPLIVSVNQTSNETTNLTHNQTFTNQTLNLTQHNQTQNNSRECPAFSITTPKQVYTNKEKIKYNLSFTDTPASFVITYWIEELSGNTIRKPRTTQNTHQKSYTPSIAVPEKALLVKAEALFENCDLSAEKLLVVQNNAVSFSSQGSSSGSPSSSTSSTSPQTSTARFVPKISTPIAYDLAGFPENTTLSNNTAKVNITLVIRNNNAAHFFDVWSYVYRGSKSFSGKREANVQRFVVGADKTKTVQLQNTANLTAGQYKLKVKIRKDNQKSTTDLTESLVFVAGLEPELPAKEMAQHSVVKEDIKKLMKTQQHTQTPQTSVPESTYRASFEPRHVIPYLIIATLVVLALCLIWTAAL